MARLMNCCRFGKGALRHCGRNATDSRVHALRQAFAGSATPDQRLTAPGSTSAKAWRRGSDITASLCRSCRLAGGAPARSRWRRSCRPLRIVDPEAIPFFPILRILVAAVAVTFPDSRTGATSERVRAPDRGAQSWHGRRRRVCLVIRAEPDLAWAVGSTSWSFAGTASRWAGR